MLSRSENEIMRAVYDLCDGTDGCLVSPVDILCLLPPKRKYDIPKIDSVLHDLSYDGYFDIITSERKGENVRHQFERVGYVVQAYDTPKAARYRVQNSARLRRSAGNVSLRTYHKRIIRLGIAHSLIKTVAF